MIFKDSMKPTVLNEVQHMRQCSRRIFLKCGLGACSISALIPLLSARPIMPYYKAVFDERFEEVRLRWKLGRVWLIGLTTAAALFCLHLLARVRMRMHLPWSDPSDLVLWIIAPSARVSAKEIAIA
jgi:putative copper export protein